MIEISLNYLTTKKSYTCPKLNRVQYRGGIMSTVGDIMVIPDSSVYDVVAQDLLLTNSFGSE